MIAAVLAIFGLSLFEIISSVDNAIINAEVLSTMKPKYRKWFLFWGILFGVFVVRGLLPLLIVMLVIPNLGFVGALTATFSNDPYIAHAIENAAPILLMAGGVFLVFVFFHWLFLAFSAVVGSTVFFITHGFKQQAEIAEKNLMDRTSSMSDISKIMYLEVIDASFSIDGVLGAFAFTFSVPIILLGNGLGAIVLRQLTISNIDRIKKFLYLKNGAMYSILFLGAIMIAESFGADIPHWVSPVITFVIVGYFFLRSRLNVRPKS